ncbi:hypothetical protein [Haloarcula pellucida]|uniref:Uncharacterized protein n=1 Tax=Haloarcula pellucida TaxID=1427151 RepID=A0A830GT49_9EURY|nr:hypothetical protein [Halomicroarcula pellucida]MBX0350546.1 hypothetical protein [Halomicroarcula pellucida]GGO03835.1 hypothetical protein GCM10009030_39930 [Halomicroarcula pellucida]
MTDTTLFGFDRSTVRSAGWGAAVAVAVVILFVEPWLQRQGLERVVLLLYAVLLPIIAWSLIEDIRAWRGGR